MNFVQKVLRKAILSRYDFFEFLGVHVTPLNYSSPIPENKDLTDALFKEKSECIGLNWNLDVQQQYLNEIFPMYATEVKFYKNSGLSLVDAAILHAMIRHHRPQKIVEIGAGASTQIAARSCVMNQKDGNVCELIAVEPYPNKVLKEGFPGFSKLVVNKAEDVNAEEIIDCDLLLIDSSHVIKIGGDVNYEILEIAPRLKRGALIHWHDILLPGEYWKKWVKDAHLFWTEQYLLHAFLKFNSEFEIIWASRYMHLENAEAIKAVFPYFEPENHHITSFWIRRK